MMRWLLLVVIACGSTTRHVAAPNPTKGFAATFASAAQTGDVATIRRMLGPKVVIGGLWFADADCRHEFIGGGDIGGPRLDELARCLATLKPVVGRRSELPDVVALTYAPGFEIEARFIDRDEGPWLSWIGYESRLEENDALPTITPDTLESLRVAGERDPRTAQPADDAWIKVCIDATGTVTGAHVRAAASMGAARRLAELVGQWRFHAFAPAGQPVPACSLVEVNAYPHAKKLAMPPAIATPNGEPMLWDRAIKPLSHEYLPLPSRAVLSEMRRTNQLLVVSFMYCVNDQGRVYSTRLLRSSGLPRFDEDVRGYYERKVFAPYLDDGKPIAVCSSETHVLSSD